MAKRNARRIQKHEEFKAPQQPYVMQEPTYQSPSRPNNHIQPKTENQEELIYAINNSEISVAEGPAGVGKTYIVGSLASKYLSEGYIDKIVLTRANVTVGKTIGLLPGTVEDKMTPLLLPILNVFKERMGKSAYEYNMAKKKVEMQPIEYIRGMSFKNTFLIIDEAQNLNIDEVLAIVTRFESGRIVFMGDPLQRDLPRDKCGLIWLEEFARRNNLNYPVIQFTLDDIVRSDLVKEFLIALYRERGLIREEVQISQEKSALLS